MAAIFYFSSESQPLPELTVRVWDKLLHTTEYAGLSLLVFRALDGEGIGRLPAALLTIAIVSGYGATDEWHQAYVPLRSSDIHDWLADSLGASVGAAAYWIVSTVSRRPRPLRR
jgi:VanZ family protein